MENKDSGSDGMGSDGGDDDRSGGNSGKGQGRKQERTAGAKGQLALLLKVSNRYIKKK